jgi:hypothetical protein
MQSLLAADNIPIIPSIRHRGTRADARVASARVVVTYALALLLVTATLLVSARTAIGPLLQSAADERAIRDTGAVVYTLPDGIYCRHLTFDNVTAEIKEGEMQLCGEGFSRARFRPRRSFAWGPR